MIALVIGVVAAVLLVIMCAPGRRPVPRRSADVEPAQAPGRHMQSTVELLERMSRDVRSGTAFRTALVDALEHDRDTFPSLRERLRHGGSVAAALDDVDTHSHDDRVVLHALRLAATTGGSTADTIDRVATVLRERQTWRAERRAQAAQARLSARMLTVLPIAVALWGVASGPRVRDVYASSPAAALTTAVGVSLNVLGWWWMRHLVRGPDAS